MLYCSIISVARVRFVRRFVVVILCVIVCFLLFVMFFDDVEFVCDVKVKF